jgi:hypothetical protein
MSAREIAAELKITEKAVKWVIYKARKNFNRLFSTS